MEIFKACMICKKNMAMTACQKCGILLCNEHTKGGFCFTCFPRIKRENLEKNS
ncbi:hypothetical protein HYS50_01560 [Candidatus Woesearchaeota archaeon]|nr:hypothetical protein [Candidatus Woesearchaeota archaeon]